MATTDADRTRILSQLDEIFSAEPGFGRSSLSTTDAIGEAKAISASTSDKEYRSLMRAGNATSHSKLSLLVKCARYYELDMLRANSSEPAAESTNIDFAFGHAVGSGIQTYGATRDLVSAQFAAFMAWKVDYAAEKLDARGNPTGKSLAMALHAVEQFQYFYNEQLSEYDVLRFPDGRPAVEISFAVDTQNGYFHFGHIDTVLRNRVTGKLAVWEGKTTGANVVADAAYANSYQALGYSVVVDAMAQELGVPGGEYEVLYIVYSSKDREFHLLPFTKNRTQRAEWLQSLLLTHNQLQQYKELGFYPKNGEQCLDKWGKTCKWYGTCQMRNESLFPGVEVSSISGVDAIKKVDFLFTLDQLVAAQRNRG